jgi:hypothetical protein
MKVHSKVLLLQHLPVFGKVMLIYDTGRRLLEQVENPLESLMKNGSMPRAATLQKGCVS